MRYGKGKLKEKYPYGIMFCLVRKDSKKIKSLKQVYAYRFRYSLHRPKFFPLSIPLIHMGEHLFFGWMELNCKDYLPFDKNNVICFSQEIVNNEYDKNDSELE